MEMIDIDQPLTEEQLHKVLEKFFSSESSGGDLYKYFDTAGQAGFVITCFNHIVSDDKLAEDATPDDRRAALNAASYVSLPYVTPSDEGQIGPAEATPHGVQAVAASMLASLINNQALPLICQTAGEHVIMRGRMQ